MECKREKNKENCNCSYEPACVRKGIGCECIKHHREKDELPACYFSAEAEKTFDRSFEKFIEVMSE